MKKTWIAFAAATWLLLQAPAFAGHIIHLKDGARFLVDQYVEQGDQIRFKRYGGFIGIEKDRVSRIEEIEDTPEQTRVPADKPIATAPGEAKTGEPVASHASQGIIEEPSAAGKRGGVADTPKEKEGERPAPASQGPAGESDQEKAARIKAFLEEKRQIMQEMERATEAFKEAKAAHDTQRKKQFWDRLLTLQKKLTELRERVMAQHEGSLPGWWNGTAQAP